MSGEPLHILSVDELVINRVNNLSVELTSSRSALSTDNGNLLINSTAGDLVYTVQSGLPMNFGLTLIQESTGIITAAAGAGVTFVGDGLLATAVSGDVISIVWVAADTYVVKVG